jgi:uncharacterized membrane protein HdeD (DUF308 family)
MSTQPRDVAEQERNNPQHQSWGQLLKAIFLAVCGVVVIIDHAWANAEKFKHLFAEFREGRLSLISWLMLATIIATIAFFVVMLKDGQEFMHQVRSMAKKLKGLIGRSPPINKE